MFKRWKRVCAVCVCVYTSWGDVTNDFTWIWIHSMLKMRYLMWFKWIFFFKYIWIPIECLLCCRFGLPLITMKIKIFTSFRVKSVRKFFRLEIDWAFSADAWFATIFWIKPWEWNIESEKAREWENVYIPFCDIAFLHLWLLCCCW